MNIKLSNGCLFLGIISPVTHLAVLLTKLNIIPGVVYDRRYPIISFHCLIRYLITLRKEMSQRNWFMLLIIKYKEEQERYSSPTGAIKNNEQTLINSKVFKNQFMCIKFSDLQSYNLIIIYNVTSQHDM